LDDADWLTVNACPAIVMTPARAAPALAATLNATVPEPVPEAPAVTVIHWALVVAVQLQVAADAVTTTDPAPPAAAIVSVV
jgi:hypothetical protein